MITHEEALKLFTKISPIAQTEKLPLEKALGRILKQDILAPCDLPLFNNSAMDGIAIRICDLLTDVPIVIQGTRFAKAVKDTFDAARTKAIRIMTGAQVPPWTDLVVPVEFTQVVGKKDGKEVIQFTSHSFKNGDHIRLAGQDYKKGEMVFKAGSHLSANHLMVLANFGINKVTVLKIPKIWIATTGDEVKEPGSSLKKGEIYNSCGIYLKSRVLELRFPLQIFLHLKDKKEKIKSFLISWLKSLGPSFLITSGAVSQGEKDDLPKLAKELAEEFEGTFHFHKVAIRPGKPILFVSFGKDHYWIGAPGNVISTTVAWTFFIRPFLHQWTKIPLPSVTKAILAQDFKKPEGLKAFFRGVFDGKNVSLFSHQGSQCVKASALGNVFVELEREGKIVPAGTEVRCTFLA